MIVGVSSFMESCDNSRILIVDDEKGIRELFKKILSLDIPDCRVDLAVNGLEAIDVFKTAHHKVILMDLSMPVMDGEVSFKEIMKYCDEADWEKPSVVFCTGFAPPNTIQSVVGTDTSHALLAKPVSRDTIVKTLKSKL